MGAPSEGGRGGVVSRWEALAIGLGALAIVAALIGRRRPRSPDLSAYRPLDTRPRTEREFNVITGRR